MNIRPFRPEDAAELAALAETCSRGESDFVLNPLWETAEELFAEFDRHGIDPQAHLLVADGEEEGLLGMVGFLRRPGAADAGMFCPIVRRDERGRGLGGRLIREALAMGTRDLGIRMASASVGTRNRAGYALLTAFGFRPVRQVYVMRCDLRPGTEKLPIEGLELTPAEAGDAAAILEVYLSCGFPPRDEEQTRAAIEDGRHAHWVARDADGQVVAFVELETHWPRRPWVAFVGVPPELRDRGLGSSLVGLALARQFDAGSRSALLALGPANRTAVRAYEKVGFRRWRLADVLERAL
ncbi:MAG: GNAT family N-acetyltransferase [Myxococcota bacterium]